MPTGPTRPAGYRVGSPARYYDIGTAAAFTGHVLGVPSLVYLYPHAATADLVRSFESWGARIDVSSKTLARAERAAALPFVEGVGADANALASGDTFRG